MRVIAILFALASLLPTRALAQRTLAQDTMSETTPVALTCGFCAMEAYGVVFRELGAGGLTPADFPLTLHSFSVALGDADVSADGATCTGRGTGGSALVHVEIWAGTTLPSGNPRAFPVAGEPWEGETLVYAADDIPVALSVPTTEGATGFNLMLNEFDVLDESGEDVVVAEGNTYLRAVVVLASNGMHNAICEGALEAPTGFPVRDDDGSAGAERSFIYAGGYGWAWNEALPGGAAIAGDWGIRLSITSMPTARDAGTTADASVANDAGANDAAIDAGAPDASTVPGGGGSCTCRAAGSSGRSSTALALTLACLAMFGRVRRRALRR